MTHDERIVTLTLKAQERVFRLAARDYGLSLADISRESNLKYETVRSYAGHKGTQAMMPLSALNKLFGVIPDVLLSHLLDPGNRHVVVNTDDDGDFDAVVPGCVTYLNTYTGARHPQSPEGVNIAPCEQEKLRAAKRQLQSGAAA